MVVRIEKALADEFDIAIQLLNELYIELGEEEESVKYLDQELLQKITATGTTEIYLARTDNSMAVGIMTITECQSIYAGGYYGLIDEMYIKLEFRSKSIGKQFIEKAREIGAERKWNRIDVTAPTEERWKRTVAFYEKSGFVFTGPKMKLII
jgi:GNAT superfamily N-acetyltransferase